MPMASPRHDRIFPLSRLHAYPGNDWLDVTFFLPRADDARRRVWLMAPEGAPAVRINDATLDPQDVVEGAARWVDYGVAELPTGFSQLRVRGMDAGECAAAHLLITEKLDFDPRGATLCETERALWGLARCDAGSTMISPSRLTVGSPARFRVRYTARPRGLPAGALVRFSLPKQLAHPQTDDPDAPGYTHVARADAEVRVASIEGSVESHEKADIICRLEAGLCPSEGFELYYFADWTCIFPNTARAVDRPYWYSKLPPLSAAAAVSEQSPFVALSEGSGHTVEWLPGPAERLHLFLPGRRRASESLSLRGTFTDHYRNVPPAGPVPRDVELRLVGAGVELALGTPAGHFRARHRFEVPLPALAPGVYRAEAVRHGTGAVIARSNPMEIIGQDDGRQRVFWGEIHAHTEMSDGCGAYDELYRHACEEGCLDFAAAADHACYFSDNQWQWMQDVTNAWNRPGRFATLIGYEWAGRQVHRNVYTSRERLDLFRGMYPPTSSIDNVWGYFHGDRAVVGGPHAVLAHGLVWEFHDPDVERFVEVYSMWGAGDRRDNPLTPDWAARNERGISVNQLLDGGARLGFTGGGDCHEGHAGFSSEDPEGQGTVPHTFAAPLRHRCGMTAAVMPELTRECLLSALRSRETYATTGARILLDFAAAGLPMGAEGEADAPECRASVHALEPIEQIEIVRDGHVVHAESPNALDATVAWQDAEAAPGAHYYYLRVVQSDGEMAWSSPVWVTVRA